jgi:hypothetical protein
MTTDKHGPSGYAHSGTRYVDFNAELDPAAENTLTLAVFRGERPSTRTARIPNRIVLRHGGIRLHEACLKTMLECRCSKLYTTFEVLWHTHIPSPRIDGC